MNNSCWCTLNYPIVLCFTVFAYFAEEYHQKITWIKKDIKSLLFISKCCSKMMSTIPTQDMMGDIELGLALISQ